MFFGEGAGTRRKLLNVQIEDKMIRVPGYMEAFNRYYDQQDMLKHAEGAIKERKRLDAMRKANQNYRALRSGNMKNVTTGLAIVLGAAYVAQQTGYDKVIEQKVKDFYKQAKVEFKFQKSRLQGRNVEKIH